MFVGCTDTKIGEEGEKERYRKIYRVEPEINEMEIRLQRLACQESLKLGNILECMLTFLFLKQSACSLWIDLTMPKLLYYSAPCNIL